MVDYSVRNMPNTRVLISGASVAGPALAFWLNRHGFQPTIVERAAAPRPGGQAVDLRGAGREAAERMGLMPQIRQAHTGVRGMALVDRAGRRQATMMADLLGHSGGFIADIEILRGDPVGILYDATREDAEYVFDDSIVDIAEHEHGVDVSFEHGLPRTFDLVVGADGLHSNVRRLVFGKEAHFVRDLGAYVSIFAMTAPQELNGIELLYSVPGKNGMGGKTAAVYPIADTTCARGMLFFTSPLLNGDRRDLDQQKALVAQAFEGEGWYVPRLVEAMWAAPDFYFDRVSQVQLPAWSIGRTVLLGDAGYCPSSMAGLGTSMAMVGAYVLAGELAAAAGDHRAAFASYEHQMRSYVAGCQQSVGGGRWFLLPKNRVEMWLRNLSLRMLPYLPWRGVIAAGMQKVASGIVLKNYGEAGALAA